MNVKKLALVVVLSLIILIAGPVVLDFAFDTDSESVIEAAYFRQAPVGTSDTRGAPGGASDVRVAPLP